MKTGEEPGAGEANFAVNGGAGNVEDLSGFFYAAAENNPGNFLKKGEGLCAVSALAGSRRASVIDESQTHKLFVESLEVGAAFKAGFAPGLIFEEELIEQPGGLQELPFSLATKIGSGNGVQLWIDERRKTVKGGAIATAPLVEQQGNVGVAHEAVNLKFTVLKTV